MVLKTKKFPKLIDRERTSYKWWIAFAVTLSSFVVNLSQSAVQVSVPSIMTTFGFNVDQAQWLIIGYAIAAAMLMPSLGWLGNRLGNRLLYFLCMLVFTIGAGLCGSCWSGASLIAFRVLQGMGGGLILPMTMAIGSGAFPLKQRGIVVGVIGVGIALGPALGPVIGGYLAEHLSWRMVFFLTVILGLVCMSLIVSILPNTREAEQRSLDVMGLLFMSVSIVSLLVALSRGHRDGWDTAFIQRLFWIAGVGVVLFIGWEYCAKKPLIDLQIYRNAIFCGVSISVLLFFMIFVTSNFLQTILLQRLLDFTPLQAGYALLPGALAVAAVFPFAGRLADLVDRRLILLGALCLLTLSSYGFTFLRLDWPLSWIMWLTALRFVGSGFFLTAATAAALSQLPPDKVRIGSGLLNLAQNGLGGTLGLAVGTTFLQYRLTVQRGLFEQPLLSGAGWGEGLASSQGGGAQVAEQVQFHLSQQASVVAYQDCFILLTVLGLASILLMLVILRRPEAKSPGA
jgi:EmrB/QacA subfamily drug resistance transporter